MPKTVLLKIVMPLLGLALAMLFVIETKTAIPIFNFRPNGFAWLSLLGIIAISIATGFALRHQRAVRDNPWLIADLTAGIIFGLGELFQRLSSSPSSALFWAQISGVGVSFGAAFILLFAIRYTEREAPNPVVTTFLLMGAATIAFFQANGGLIFKTNASAIKLYPWGYNNLVGPAFFINFLWFLYCYVAAIVLLIRFWSKVTNKSLKNQAVIYAIAICMPLIGGGIFDSLLPALHIETLPPLGMLFSTITGIMFVIGSIRYKVFRFSPTTLSQNILATMNEAVVATNQALQIEFMNNKAQQLLQIFDDNETKSIANLLEINGSTEQFAKELEQTVESQSIKPIKDVRIVGMAEQANLRISVSKVLEGDQLEGYIFVIADITELTAAYTALENAKKGVDKIVAERTQELQAAKVRLQEADTLKTEFVRLTSHSLRTPIASLRGYLELLNTTAIDDKQRVLLDKVKDSAGRLKELVEELLTISSLEAGSKEVQSPMKASSIAAWLNEEGGARSKESGIQFLDRSQIPLPEATVNVTLDRLRPALHNLMDNAFKYTKVGYVSLQVIAEEAYLVIIIADTGIGIDADELPKIFTKFHRGTDTLEYNYEGEGIGLYLTKLVIEEHHGRLDIASIKGKGTTVRIKLPLAEHRTMDKSIA